MSRRVAVVHPAGAREHDVMLQGASGPALLAVEEIVTDVHVPRGWAFTATEIEPAPPEKNGPTAESP